MVLLGPAALWVTSWPFAQYVKHEWAGAWVNSCFRNEGTELSSELIRQAVAHTRWFRTTKSSWDEPEPRLGMITFVDQRKIRSGNPGYCYQCAGFKRVGHTKGGLVALQLLLCDMPPPVKPLGVLF